MSVSAGASFTHLRIFSTIDKTIRNRFKNRMPFNAIVKNTFTSIHRVIILYKFVVKVKPCTSTTSAQS